MTLDPWPERFWAKVRRGGPDECWEWTGTVRYDGYGHVKVSGKYTGAHRAAWVLENGPIPDGLFICHHCDNRPCVRVDHLFLGTQLDNMRDKIKKGRAFTIPVVRGVDKHNAKLSEADVLLIRESLGTHRELAKKFGVSKTTINSILQGRGWKHVGEVEGR